MPALQDAVSLRTRALHGAVRKGYAAQGKTLIASGVDLNAGMDGHATPLLTAVSFSSPKMVEVLLAPIWVWLILGETASAGTFLGGGILLLAIAGNALSGLRRKPLTRPLT